MGLLSRLSSAVRSAFSPHENFDRPHAFFFDNARGQVELQDPYAQHGWIHGLISVSARMLASVPLRIVEPDTEAMQRLRRMPAAKARRELLQRRSMPGIFPRLIRAQQEPMMFAEESPWFDLFEEPNEWQGPSEFWTATTIHVLDDGGVLLVALGEADGVLSSGGMPDEMVVVPWRSGAAELSGDKQRWRVKVRDREFDLPQEQVIPIKLYDPRKPNPRDCGLPPSVAARSEIKQDLAANRFNEAFFDNGAEIGTIVYRNEQIKEQDAQAIMRRFEDRHLGAHKAHRPLVIGGATKIERNPMRHKDMDFVEGRKWNMRTALAAYGFHKAILGDTDELNRATITEARKMIWSNLLLPFMAQLEDQLRVRLFNRWGDGVQRAAFDVSGVEELQDDLLGKAKVVTELVGNRVPLNDAKDLVGLPLPDYEWGDEPHDPFGGMGFGGAQQDASQAAEAKGGDAGDAGETEEEPAGEGAAAAAGGD